MLITAFLLLPLVTSRFATSYSFHGPFPIGKSELDGDPAGDMQRVLQLGAAAETPSELVAGGLVRGLQTLKADPSSGLVTLEPSGVDWNKLVQRLSDMAVLEWQGFAATSIPAPSSPAARPHPPSPSSSRGRRPIRPHRFAVRAPPHDPRRRRGAARACRSRRARIG